MADPAAASAASTPSFIPQFPQWGQGFGGDVHNMFSSVGSLTTLPGLDKLKGMDVRIPGLDKIPGLDRMGSGASGMSADAAGSLAQSATEEAAHASSTPNSPTAARQKMEETPLKGQPPRMAPVAAATRGVVKKADVPVNPANVCCGLGPLKRPEKSSDVVWLSSGTRWAKKPATEETEPEDAVPQRKLAAADANLLNRTLSKRSNESGASSASTAKSADQERTCGSPIAAKRTHSAEPGIKARRASESDISVKSHSSSKSVSSMFSFSSKISTPFSKRGAGSVS